MSVEIKNVKSKSDLRAFINLHYDLYKGNPYDVPSLYSDEVNTLSKDRNAAFDFCEAEYFLAYKDGKLCGRVAAIINHRANEKWNKLDVRFGWLDFIDDIEVSRALFKAVENYGRSKGMTAIIGPLGFSDMDKEGMLTYGFDRMSTMATLYNYDYYPRHMEQLEGWVKDNDYVEYLIPIPEKVPDKLVKLATMIEQRYNLHAKKVTPKDIRNGYARKLFEIINATYGDLYGFVTLTDHQIDQYVKMFLPAVDFDLVTVIVDGNNDDKIIGIAITIPSLAKALKKCHRGRLFPFGWWHVLRAVKFGKTEGVDLLLIGVLPEYRGKGANALILTDLIPRYIARGYKWGESQVEMETNTGVQGQWNAFEHENHKKRRCFRKEIK
ncbi:MAG: N-acetyltransferase [Bacteroidota bacterium]|nr:N-acetyltransferase [Bacteroidota bacterium]